MKSFEDLEVWNRACQLYLDVFKMFRSLQDWGFRDQLCRSALSIPSNIAEGFERGSTQEFIRFLYIAKGSSGELRTQLHLALKIGYSSAPDGQNLLDECRVVSGMLQNLISSLKSKQDKNRAK
jgi:four helix bundle protein